ncbi:MAG: TOBE domain-containing protein, partial [Synergistaceae bacterium]|nr:TOBE domain-containing protein [Synergistaceae bacterium]
MSLSDKIIVMRKGRIEQMGTPSEIYRDPSNVFVAGFVGKAAFFHGKVLSVDSSECTVAIKNRNFRLHRFSPALSEGSDVRVMCRPESLTLQEPGEGIAEGRVKMNVYLGNSIESYIDTDEGEILVQIDNPDIKHIYAEGEAVSVSLRPELAKALAAEA